MKKFYTKFEEFVNESLFPTHEEEQFNDSFKVGERHIHIRRDENGTFMSVTGLNFLGKMNGVDFRASDNQDFTNGYYIPRMKELSLEELRAFGREIIRQIESGETEWDSADRRKIFHIQGAEYKR